VIVGGNLNKNRKKMSLKPLIQNQTLIIDDHKRGAREEKNWDNKKYDVHIDKKTKYSIDGKKQEVRIKIPINSDKKIEIYNAKNKKHKIPRRLEKEIIEAFSKKEIRSAFIKDIVKVLDNFSSNLDSIEKARETLERIAKHFGLKWSGQEIDNFLKDALIELICIYSDVDGEQYYIKLDKHKIRISSVDSRFRGKYKIKE